ncbi:hypothetical protein [Aliiglaciecola sp. NS0011-25]|uniref:tetratricopeptide repeat protein n=1 Tax=Aliiglaciecola sp. NS0011-25 TaxID=3127654 RepID=UPI00310C2399
MKKLSIVLLTLGMSTFAQSQSIEKAMMLSEQGLSERAKSELVDVIFSNKANSNKSKAYYELGNIAFRENRTYVALSTWTTLIEIYPQSVEAKLVKEKIVQLSEIVGESSQGNLDNSIASSYLKNANFWSDDRSKKFTIDSSWLPKIDMAIKWYDKVIKEFPGSRAAKIAYDEKITTLFGWKEIGKYGSSYGVRADFEKYMPMVLSTFDEFESKFPDASSLQAQRYQIAQAYWSQKNWTLTKEWLNKIITAAGEGDSFYKDTAINRLNKVEY